MRYAVWVSYFVIMNDWNETLSFDLNRTIETEHATYQYWYLLSGPSGGFNFWACAGALLYFDVNVIITSFRPLGDREIKRKIVQLRFFATEQSSVAVFRNWTIFSCEKPQLKIVQLWKTATEDCSVAKNRNWRLFKISRNMYFPT